MNERRRWWREPLLHFLILGSLVFSAHHWLFGRSASDYVAPEDAPIAQLREDWRAARGELPSAEQEAALINEWIEEEVLYRRAVELGIDRNDTIVRRRLAQRMRFLLEDRYRLEPPSDAQLRTWLGDHPERFAEPGTTSFEHLFFSRSKRGAKLVDDAQATAEVLQSDPEAQVSGDPFFRGAAFEAATDAEIRRAFGRELAEAMADVPMGLWAGPLSSAYGLHLVLVTDRTTPPPPTLEAIRARVEEDWLRAERARMNAEALERLKARYAPPRQK
jgi:hypothetical protein